jgi:O-antigen/teichoic acid export membrane protein
MSQDSAKQEAPRLLRDSSLYFIGNVAGRVVGFLMIPFYAGHLTTSQYGVLSLVELATTITAIVFGLQSIGQTLTRIYFEQDTDVARRRVASTAMVASVVGSVLVAAIACLFARQIAVAVNLADQVALLRVSFIAMAFSTVAEFLLVYQRMRARARFFLIYSSICLIAAVTLNIWFIGFLDLGVWGFVLTKLIVASIGTAFLLIVVTRDIGMAVVVRYAASLARFGAPLTLAGACFFAIHFSDRLFLAHVSRAEVGVYSLAYQFAMLLSALVGDSFAKSWDVSFYRYAEDEGWQARFAHIGAWLVFVLAAGAMGIALFGRDIIRIMAPQSYTPPELLLPVLVFAYFFRELGDFFRNMLLIDIGSGLVGRIALAGAAVNLALNYVLISSPLGLGIWGAAIATFATWVLYCGVCWVAAWRLHRISFAVRPLARLLALGALIMLAQSLTRPDNRFVAMAADCGWWFAFLAASVFVYLKSGQRGEIVALVRKARALPWTRWGRHANACSARRPQTPLL